MVKLFDLIAQAAYGAIGHHHIFIVTLVITHWGVFVMLAYLIYMQTELEEESMKSGGAAAATAPQAQFSGSCVQAPQLQSPLLAPAIAGPLSFTAGICFLSACVFACGV